MATHDRFPTLMQHTLEPSTQERSNAQGELFSRLMLRQLPLYKHGPEDEALVHTPTAPQIH